MKTKKKKNPAAVALGKLAAKKVSPELRKQWGRLGGLVSGRWKKKPLDIRSGTDV